jgi:hypothetical protein
MQLGNPMQVGVDAAGQMNSMLLVEEERNHNNFDDATSHNSAYVHRRQ